MVCSCFLKDAMVWTPRLGSGLSFLCYNKQPEIGKKVANLTVEDDIIGDSEQIQLTNMRGSGAPRQSQEIHWQAYLSVGFARNSRL